MEMWIEVFEPGFGGIEFVNICGWDNGVNPKKYVLWAVLSHSALEIGTNWPKLALYNQIMENSGHARS